MPHSVACLCACRESEKESKDNSMECSTISSIYNIVESMWIKNDNLIKSRIKAELGKFF